MQDFRKLKVWEKAHQLTLGIYKMSAAFPKDELYGLTSQVRRSSSSIPTNIAEGCGRGGGEFKHYIQIAMGSACELEYQLLLTHDLGYISEENYQRFTLETNEIKRMLTSLILKIRSENASISG